MAKILKFSDCLNIDLFNKELLDLIEKCFIDYSNKKCELKPKIVLRKENSSFFTTMPAIYGDVMSVKSIQRDETINQPSIRGMLILNNNISGDLLSLMDSTYLTAVRTGLTAYISLKATTNIIESKTVSIIGIGNAMIAFLKALQIFKNEHNIRKIYVKDYKDHLSRVENILDDDFQIEIINENEDLMIADIIISAITSANGPIIKEYNNNWKSKTIIPIHVRGWEHFDKKINIVTTDFYEQTKDWIRDDTIELGDILSGKVDKVRTVPDMNVMSYNYGGALIDLVIANYIYNKAVEFDIGIDLELWDMKSKYF